MRPTTNPLARVTRAATDRRRADEEYRAALLAARSAGETFSAIGQAAGVTKQAIRKAVNR